MQFTLGVVLFGMMLSGATAVFADENPGVIISDWPVYSFSSLPITSSVSHTFTVTNQSYEVVRLENISSLVSPFRITGGTCAADQELEPEQSCTIAVTFAPTQNGIALATLQLQFTRAICQGKGGCFGAEFELSVSLIGSGFTPTLTTITASKTAVGSVTQTSTFSWTLQKTTSTPLLTIGTGATQTASFSLTATRNGPTIASALSVSGQVCIDNTGPAITAGLTISDTIEVFNGSEFVPLPGAIIDVPVSGEVAAGATQCFPYSFDNLPLNVAPVPELRNHAVVSIVNFSGHEGTVFPTDMIQAFTPSISNTNIDDTASLNDGFACPAGFSCTPSFPTTTLTGSQTIPYAVSITNNSAGCGQTRSQLNTATLTPGTTGTPRVASASVGIQTPACQVLIANYSGRIIYATGTVNGSPILIGDSGPFPVNRNPPILDAPMTNVEIPDVLLVTEDGNMVAPQPPPYSMSALNLLSSLSLAIDADFGLTVNFGQIQVSSTCNTGTASSQATESLTNVALVEGGFPTPITVTGQPNQIVQLNNGGMIIFNEQTIVNSGTTSSIDVNMIHVIAPGMDLIIGRMHTDIDCVVGI